MKKIVVFFALFLTMFRSTAQENGVDVRNQATSILSATKDLLIKIADSQIDLNEISLDDQVLVDRGILSQSEMNEFKEILQRNSNEIKDKLEISSADECESCSVSDEQKVEKLRSVIRVCSTTQPPKISAKMAAPHCDKALA